MKRPIQVLSPLGEAGLLAVNKPAGMLVIPGRAVDQEPSLREALREKLGRDVWVVHRLDRDTSGVVVFALDAASHRTASMAFEHGRVKKRYVALVNGLVNEPLDLQFALVEARKRRMKVAPPGAGKEARTLVRPRQLYPVMGKSLVECEPLTGRQHQIRVHLAAAGHPLVVDHQYGEAGPKVFGAATLSRTPLHAESLEISELGFRAEAPLADDLAAVLRELS